jgi:flagellar hook-basal body complex protein FliE
VNTWVQLHIPLASAQPQRSRRDLRVAAPKDDNFGSVLESLFDKITSNQNTQQEQQQQLQLPRVTQLIDEITKAHEFRDSALQKNDARLLRMAEMLIDRLENEIQQSASAFSIN